MTSKERGAPLSCNRQEADGGSANKTYPSANMSVSISRGASAGGVRPRPVEITPDIYEALLHDPDPFVALGAPIARERGIIVVVDELPAAPAPGMRQKGVA